MGFILPNLLFSSCEDSRYLPYKTYHWNEHSNDDNNNSTDNNNNNNNNNNDTDNNHDLN